MALTLDDAVRTIDRQLHPLTLREVDDAARTAALRDELEWAIGPATHDLAFAREYRRRMPHPGTVPEDYLNRWVDVGTDLEVLIGPRHRARDRSRPFVAVDAASRRIRPDDLPALGDAAVAAFGLFAPRSVVFWDRGLPSEWPGTSADMRLLAGQAGELRTRSIPTDFEIAAPQDMTFADRYRAGFALLLESHPGASEWTRPAELDVLIGSQQQGLVLEAFVDGRWAGIIAGEPASSSGLRGLNVTTIFVLPEFRGRSLGAALSIALARSTRLTDADHVFGTIHWENTAARAAAAAAGRQDRGGEVVVPIGARPAHSARCFEIHLGPPSAVTDASGTVVPAADG